MLWQVKDAVTAAQASNVDATHAVGIVIAVATALYGGFREWSRRHRVKESDADLQMLSMHSSGEMVERLSAEAERLTKTIGEQQRRFLELEASYQEMRIEVERLRREVATYAEDIKQVQAANAVLREQVRSLGGAPG